MRNNGNQNRRQNGRHSNTNGNLNRNGKGTNSLNRSYESNGPGVKVRGSAQNIAEKYIQLARDAQASGDHVAFENFMQHAEHYLRLINAVNDAMRLANPNWRPEPVPNQDDDEEDEEQKDLPSPHATRRVFDINDEQPSDAQREQPQFVPRQNRDNSNREGQNREGQHRDNPNRDNSNRDNSNRDNSNREGQNRDNRFQRPRYETSQAPSDEGLEPRAPEPRGEGTPEQQGERRPRFNRFERNRNRNRPFDARDGAGEQPVLGQDVNGGETSAPAPSFVPAPLAAPAPVVENFGLPAFITAPKPASVSEDAPAVVAPRRRGRPPRDTSQDIVIAEG
jgi:hypothetical protein